MHILSRTDVLPKMHTPQAGMCSLWSQETQSCSVRVNDHVPIVAFQLTSCSTHEELLVKSHKQDLEIKSLLEMFDHLTTEQRKERFLAKSQPSSSNSSSTSTSLNSDNNSWASSPGQWSPDSQFIDTHVQSATRHHVPSAAQLSKLFYDRKPLLYQCWTYSWDSRSVCERKVFCP